MKNKGFTLIELLAVIVILAIIALIATPIILNIISDARESAKISSAELIYTGVEYAYTESMYKSSSTPSDITIQDIYNNFNVRNTTKGEIEGTYFIVEASGGVICKVSTGVSGYDVKCGTEEEATKYLNKTLAAPVAQAKGTPNVPEYYSMQSTGLDIDDDLPVGTPQTPSFDYNSYLGYDAEDDKITAAYLCFVTDKQYCLKGIERSEYANNVLLLKEAFEASSCEDSGDSYGCLTENIAVVATLEGDIELANYAEAWTCFVSTVHGTLCLEG